MESDEPECNGFLYCMCGNCGDVFPEDVSSFIGGSDLGSDFGSDAFYPVPELFLHNSTANDSTEDADAVVEVGSELEASSDNPDPLPSNPSHIQSVIDVSQIVSQLVDDVSAQSEFGEYANYPEEMHYLFDLTRSLTLKCDELKQVLDNDRNPSRNEDDDV